MSDIEAAESQYLSRSRNMPDDVFLRAIEHAKLPNGEFRHFDHIRLAWLYLETADEISATRRMRTTLLGLAAKHHGAGAKYHETITRAFMRLVATSRDTIGASHSFDQFIARFPELLKKDALDYYYTKETLMSSEARAAFLPPDLRPLP